MKVTFDSIPDDVLHIICEYTEYTGYLSLACKTYRNIAKRHALARNLSKLNLELCENLEYSKHWMGARWAPFYCSSVANILLDPWTDTKPAFSHAESAMVRSEKRRLVVQGTISSKFCIF